MAELSENIVSAFDEVGSVEYRFKIINNKFIATQRVRLIIVRLIKVV